jgi:hypothetical protein
MTLPMTNDDALSLSMFIAGALMVFMPMVCAAVVLALWWRHRPGARAGMTAQGEPSAKDAALTPRR